MASGTANCNYRHGHWVDGKASPTYNSWRGMRERCNNPNHKFYKNYGGRGVKVCKRWAKFVNFLEDMGVKPEGLTLDRMENNLGYFPENCKWSTWKEQHNNKRCENGKGISD